MSLHTPCIPIRNIFSDGLASDSAKSEELLEIEVNLRVRVDVWLSNDGHIHVEHGIFIGPLLLKISEIDVEVAKYNIPWIVARHLIDCELHSILEHGFFSELVNENEGT